MRIIHDIESSMQVGGGCFPYASSEGEGYIGSRVELVIAGEHEVIHLHGDADEVLEMLRSAVNAIEGMIEVAKEDKESDLAEARTET